MASNVAIECLINLVKLQPFSSFFSLSYNQVTSYMVHPKNGSERNDIDDLKAFVDELKAMYSTQCEEDKQNMKPKSRLFNNKRLIRDLKDDGAFILYLAIIEAAKYCISHKFGTDSQLEDFFKLVQKVDCVIMDPLLKFRKVLYLNFLNNLQKFLLYFHFGCPPSVNTFKLNPHLERSLSNKEPIFEKLTNKYLHHLALNCDEPADCWRYTNHFFGSNPCVELVTSESLYNLTMLIMSAKELGDIALLHGLRRVINVTQYNVLLESVISNLETRFYDTYTKYNSCHEVQQQTLIEFLNCCIELGLLFDNQEQIERIESTATRNLYKNYLLSIHQDTSYQTRLHRAKNWSMTWSELDPKVETNKKNPIVIPRRNFINLSIPTHLNNIAKVPRTEQKKLISELELLIGQEYLTMSLFHPNQRSKDLEVYNLVTELLKGDTRLLNNLVELNRHDLYWNSLLFRQLRDTNLIDNPQISIPTLDSIKLKSARYYKKPHLTDAIAIEDSRKCFQTTEARISSYLLNLGTIQTKPDCHKLLKTIADEIKSSVDLEDITTHDLTLRTLQASLKKDPTLEPELFKIYYGSSCDTSPISILQRWKHPIESSSMDIRSKTLASLSGYLKQQLDQEPENDLLINSSFELDLKLLENIAQSNMTKHRSISISCASRILSMIVSEGPKLNKENLSIFKSELFLQSTAKVWIRIKTNLSAIVTESKHISSEWLSALIGLIKKLCSTYPSQFIYPIVVNRMELQTELVNLESGKQSEAHNNSDESSDIKSLLIDCRRKLDFWNDLHAHIASTNETNRSAETLATTERFLKEIHKISFLPGEYLKLLAPRIMKRSYDFIAYLYNLGGEYLTNSGVVRLEKRREVEKKMKILCDQSIKPIKLLLESRAKINKNQSSQYELWFHKAFTKSLKQLLNRFQQLSRIKHIVVNEIETIIKSITDLLSGCIIELRNFNTRSRQILFMEVISPVLSRLEPSLIPMPNCCNELSVPRRPPITIHKISQTVNLIMSKTSPKKLQLTGSDGISRAFLLKAHDDIRVDQLAMEIFETINYLLTGDKKTRETCKIRCYSVTPVSSRSGLIQWIEDAPSLYSLSREWITGKNGRKLAEEMFKETCKLVCYEDDHQCEVPDNISNMVLFYQTLWNFSMRTRHPVSDVRPDVVIMKKYREELKPRLFQNVIENLIERTTNELVSNLLWFQSHNSYSYWLKTQQFIRSTATMSMVGYIVGLGDRHPDNILLDQNTGEVIHIDHSICFEMGKLLTVPEKVPFRLTQNMIHAFGFAGLEGGFTWNSRNVLSVLRDNKSTLLHQLESVNLNFMVAHSSKVHKPKDAAHFDGARYAPDAHDTLQDRKQSMPARELNLCSQESDSLPNEDISHLLILDRHLEADPKSPEDVKIDSDTIKSEICNLSNSSDFQHNIKTPTRISCKTAIEIQKRAESKLSGRDENLRNLKYKKQRQAVLEGEQAVDLIILDDAQSVEDQVESLILEAVSIENYAAQYEGWAAWI